MCVNLGCLFNVALWFAKSMAAKRVLEAVRVWENSAKKVLVRHGFIFGTLEDPDAVQVTC